jgi:hypothetical protein
MTNCVKCEKSGNVEIKTENWTPQELENVMSFIDNYNMTYEQRNYAYNVYNRIFKENKQPGCGKCFVRIAKSLKIKWNELNK